MGVLCGIRHAILDRLFEGTTVRIPVSFRVLFIWIVEFLSGALLGFRVVWQHGMEVSVGGAHWGPSGFYLAAGVHFSAFSLEGRFTALLGFSQALQ